MWHGRIPGLRSLKDSQRSRLALLRSTAFRLNFLPQTTPPLRFESGASARIATINWDVNFLPVSRTCAKSDFKFSLSQLPKVSFNAGFPSFPRSVGPAPEWSEARTRTESGQRPDLSLSRSASCDPWRDACSAQRGLHGWPYGRGIRTCVFSSHSTVDTFSSCCPQPFPVRFSVVSRRGLSVELIFWLSKKTEL